METEPKTNSTSPNTNMFSIVELSQNKRPMFLNITTWTILSLSLSLSLSILQNYFLLNVT